MQPCWAEETSFKTSEYITDPNCNTMCECYNKCINRAVVIIIIIIIVIVLRFYFILQNSKITILTFMNVECWLLFWQKPAGRPQFCSLFTNCLKSFRDFNHHTLTSNNHPFHFSSERWDAALSSLSLSVLVMIFPSFSDSFKCFHTADMFAALVRTSIWSRHVIVQYNLFVLFAYSAEHRKSFFCYFWPNNFGCRTFGASLI